MHRIRDRIDRLEGSAETAEAKVHQLESRLKSAEHALAAELAAALKQFNEA